MYNKPKEYTHSDYAAFFKRDFMAELHNCRSYVASIIYNQGFSKERADRMVEEELIRFYPNGFKTKYDCGVKQCDICHPTEAKKIHDEIMNTPPF